MAVEYDSIDLSEMQSEFERVTAEPNTNQSSDFLEKFVRLPEKEGFTHLRLLPRKKGGKVFCATRVHTLKNPVTGKAKTYHCPKVLVKTERGEKWQGECIICKYYSDLWQQSESLSGKAQEDRQNAARAIKPVERYYWNAVVRLEKDPKTGETNKDVGPKIYSCGKTVHAKICRAFVGDESAGEKPLGDVTHPITGRDFRVVKKVVKGGGGAEYPNYDNSKFEEVSNAGSPEQLEKWMENLHDLQALRVVKTNEELRHALRVHLGMIREESDTETDDLAEFRTGVPASAKSTSTAEDTVREDLSVSTTVPTSSGSSDEPLADDDFMKELEDM